MRRHYLPVGLCWRGAVCAAVLLGLAVLPALGQDWQCHQGGAYAKPTPVGLFLYKIRLTWLPPFGVRCAKEQDPPKCDPSLWKHVYNPSRLIVHKACVSVTGTIVDATHGKRKDGVRHEADGDTHGWLKLDPGQEQFLNAGNMSDEGGNLVYEVVCLYRVSQKDAVSACKGYKSPVKLAPVGSHVRITGSLVQDTNHAKWNEIHPVSSIEVLP